MDFPQVAQGRIMTPEEAQIFGMGAMFEERQAAPAVRVARPRIDVALLSAGGQWGAFTAGFMTAWSANTVSPRPEAFEVVTGVSTGALLAPLVFDGPGSDATLAAVYDGIREGDILRRRPTLELLAAPSLWDPMPLSGLVDGQLTPAFLDRIAAGAATRSLLVGTVNVRTGGFEAFDITAAAKEVGPNRMPCVREALMASAAIPLAFPPRRINGDYYVDGAARQGLFLRGLAETSALPTIYVFLNNPAQFQVEEPAYSLPSLTGRTTTILSDELLRSSAIEAVQFARDQGWPVRGMFAPNITPGPDCKTKDGQKLSFCESFTKTLFAEGQKAATGQINWLGADAMLEELRGG